MESSRRIIWPTVVTGTPEIAPGSAQNCECAARTCGRTSRRWHRMAIQIHVGVAARTANSFYGGSGKLENVKPLLEKLSEIAKVEQ